MLEPAHQHLSIVRQCALVSISRSAFYYAPTGETPLNLALMPLIYEQFLETPFYGTLQMARHLRRRGYVVGRKQTSRLMAQMGLAPIYQKPRTSDPHPAHRTYKYLLRHLTIGRRNQVWCGDITYIPMRRGFLYLVAVVDWATRKVLASPSRRWRRPWPGSARRRSVHQPALHRGAEGRGRPDLHGRVGPLDGQRVHRAAMAFDEI